MVVAMRCHTSPLKQAAPQLRRPLLTLPRAAHKLVTQVMVQVRVEQQQHQLQVHTASMGTFEGIHLGHCPLGPLAMEAEQEVEAVAAERAAHRRLDSRRWRATTRVAPLHAAQAAPDRRWRSLWRA